MKKLFQIGSSCNYGAPGKIAEQIGLLAQTHGWEVYMAHGNKYKNPSELITYQTVTPFQEHIHEVVSLLLDKHGLSSTKQTERLVEKIDAVKPDIVHLHNIHGYFLNYQVLFEYLQHTDIPIVWTLHDCWPFTGHCSYFDIIGCNKWKISCNHCPGLNVYPRSLFIDRSKENYELKKDLFSLVANRLTLVPVSDWLAGFAKESFIAGANIKTIHNGIDIDTFSPCRAEELKKKHKINSEIIILGVASPWVPRKGLNDWLKLYEMLPKDKCKLMMIGLSERQLKALPKGMVGIGHTNNAKELAQYYSMADLYLNTTYEDNFPTVNLEALACGTPVITYKTGGSPEAVTPETGWVVEQGNLEAVVNIVYNIMSRDHKVKKAQRMKCRERAVSEFDKNKAFSVYIELYDELIRNHL